MRRIYTKKLQKGGNSAIISGGWGKHGPYAYGGIKTRKGASVGGSIGTQGRQLYGSLNKKSGQVRVKYNHETKKVTPRVKSYRKSKLNQVLDFFNKLMNWR